MRPGVEQSQPHKWRLCERLRVLRVLVFAWPCDFLVEVVRDAHPEREPKSERGDERPRLSCVTSPVGRHHTGFGSSLDASCWRPSRRDTARVGLPPGAERVRTITAAHRLRPARKRTRRASTGCRSAASAWMYDDHHAVRASGRVGHGRAYRHALRGLMMNSPGEPGRDGQCRARNEDLEAGGGRR